MTQTVSSIEQVLARFRQMLPGKSATAQAIDQHEPWERIAMKAIEDGYTDSADEFVRFVEACMRCSA
jgi:hypothetical protein